MFDRLLNICKSVHYFGVDAFFSYKEYNRCQGADFPHFWRNSDVPTQCFPLYTYERVESKSKGLIETSGERFGDYIRRENVSDAILRKFRERYKSGGHTPPGNASITKEDIFYYVYGILHSRSYRERFAADLKKQLPRIPLEAIWKLNARK